MAITVGNITTSAQDATGNYNRTISHNNNGDYILVGVACGYGSGAVPTGATYNGTGLTALGSVAYANSIAIYVYRLINPTSGTNDLVIQGNVGEYPYLAVTVISLSGVHQTTAEGTVATNSGGENTTPTVTVTSASGELVVDFVAVDQNANSATATVGTDQTQRSNFISGGGQSVEVRGLSSTQAGAGSVVMDWTLSGNQYWATVGVPVKPAGGGGGPPGAPMWIFNPGW